MMLRTPALICDASPDGTSLNAVDFDLAPPEVLDSARRVAEKEYRRNVRKTNELVSQMVTLYLLAENKDVAIIFNPGGWGWASVAEMPLWATILKGMQEVLEEAGLDVMITNYLRTKHGPLALLGETGALLKFSRAKGRELAVRIEHLLCHRPRLKVIIAGESNGAAMAEDAMRCLYHHPRVFSVQTGTPFWAPSKPHPRSLIINHNGIEPDTFSSGNVGRCIVANVQALFGRYKGSRGNVLFYIGAPGHVYTWEYPVVREKITLFLQQTVVTESFSNDNIILKEDALCPVK